VLDGHALGVFVEPQAARLLEDSALDGETHGDHVHFGFVALDGDGDGDGDEDGGGSGDDDPHEPHDPDA